jgi:hypothetical protein
VRKLSVTRRYEKQTGEGGGVGRRFAVWVSGSNRRHAQHGMTAFAPGTPNIAAGMLALLSAGAITTVISGLFGDFMCGRK